MTTVSASTAPILAIAARRAPAASRDEAAQPALAWFRSYRSARRPAAVVQDSLANARVLAQVFGSGSLAG